MFDPIDLFLSNLISSVLPNLIPNGLQQYLVISILISLVYYVAFNYVGNKKKAPSFLETIKVVLYGITIFLFLCITSGLNYLLTSFFIPPEMVTSIFNLLIICALFFPCVKIIFKRTSKIDLYSIGFGLTLSILVTTLIISFGFFGGILVRLLLAIRPAYWIFFSSTLILCSFLVLVSYLYVYIFKILDSKFLPKSEGFITKLFKNPINVSIWILSLFVSSSLVFALYAFNSYAVIETTSSFVSNSPLQIETPNHFSAQMNKQVTVNLHKSLFFFTPIEECNGWKIGGDGIYNSNSGYLINSTNDNLTFICQKNTEINLTVSNYYCDGNPVVCKINLAVFDTPFYTQIPTKLYDLSQKNQSCSILMVATNSTVDGNSLITETMNDAGYISAQHHDLTSDIRIVYNKEGPLVLDYFGTNKPGEFNISITCISSLQ